MASLHWYTRINRSAQFIRKKLKLTKEGGDNLLRQSTNPSAVRKTTYSPRRENSIDLTAEFEAELVDLKWLASSSVFES